MKNLRSKDIPRHAFWDIDENKLMHVERLNMVIEKDEVRLEPHRKAHYSLSYLIRGSGRHYVDFIPYNAAPGKLYLIGPSEVHWLDLAPGTLLQGFLVVFRTEILAMMGLDGESQVMMDQAVILTEFVLDDDEKTTIIPLFDLLAHEYSKAQPPDYQLLSPYLKLIFLQLFKILQKKNPKNPKVENHYWGIYFEFLSSLEKNLYRYHQVSEYAQDLIIPQKKLTRACQAITGNSPGAIIQQRLDLEAKRMLIHSSLTAKEIAYKIGFKDAGHFGKFFRRMNNISPVGFRKYQKG